MNLRDKKTGKIVKLEKILFKNVQTEDLLKWKSYEPNVNSLAELNEKYEDYEPVEPIFDEKIRRGIRAWWDMQDNPFKSAAVLCDEEKDLDGFYHWRIFGYIREGEQKESTDLCFRTKKLYDYYQHHDYTKEELCREEE